MWCDSDKITHQFVLNTWWKQDGVFAGNRKNHFEAESCQRTVSMALQLSSTCIALSLLFRLKSKIIVKGKHHSEPSTYQKRLLKVYEIWLLNQNRSKELEFLQQQRKHGWIDCEFRRAKSTRLFIVNKFLPEYFNSQCYEWKGMPNKPVE